MNRVLLVLVLVAIGTAGTARGQSDAAFLQLSDRLNSVPIETVAGEHRIVVGEGPDRRTLTPEEFVTALAQRQDEVSQQGWLFRLFDITRWTGILWVGLGFLGQVMFTGRMIIQWLASERAGRSTVPVVFWWMSLIGSSMLLVYFVWRIDIVGVAGQATGWLIYTRNLWLIHHKGKSR